MKRFTLFAAFSLGVSAQAQYGWEIDGTPVDDFLQRAEVSAADFAFPMFQRGHVFSGSNNNGVQELEITATNEDATVIYFQNEYAIFDPWTGVQYPSQKCLVTEGPNNFGGPMGVPVAYCAVGDLQIGAGQTAIYYSPIDNLGNPSIGLPNNGWMYFANPNWQIDTRDALYLPATGLLYMLAKAQFGAPWYHMVIIAVDPYTGAIVWDGIYAHFPNNLNNEPQKLTYNPTTGELVVVGHFDNGADWDSYLFHVNAAAGGVGVWEEYGGPGSNDMLYGACWVNPAAPFGGGIMAVGVSDRPGNNDTWMIRVPNAFGPAIWSHLFDNPWAPGTDDDGKQVVQRRNSAGFLEYFATGSYRVGANGGTDMQLLKVDPLGNPINCGSYGGWNNEFGFWVDHDPLAPNVGVNTYGWLDIGFFGGWDMTSFKTYYNLEAHCFDQVSVPPFTFALNFINRVAWHHEKGHKIKDIMLRPMGPTATFIPCRGPDPAGNNFRMAQPGLDMSASASADAIQIQLTAPEAGATNLTLTSITGQVMATRRVDAIQGENSISLDGLNLSAGIYLLTADNGKEQKTSKVILQ
jgi:hypothetical protein